VYVFGSAGNTMKTDGKTIYVLKQGDVKFAEAVPVEIWCAFASSKAYKITLTIKRDSCEDSDTTLVNLKSGPGLLIPNPLFQCMDGPSGTATVPFNIFGTEDVDYRLTTDNPLCAMVYGEYTLAALVSLNNSTGAADSYTRHFYAVSINQIIQPSCNA
jgi:hypothetical protein